MNYLKDLAIKAEEKKIDKTKFRYYLPGNISPYLEINQEDINLMWINESDINLIGVNPYFRNEKIFYEFLSPNIKEFSDLKNSLFNILCHFIAEIDYFYIKRLSNFEIKFIENSILKGNFGIELKEIYLKFSLEEKNMILIELRNLYKKGNNLEIFFKLLKTFFKGAILYNFNEEKDSINAYLPFKETKNNIERLFFLKEIFLPININLKIYWEYNFLIIGVDETSKLDKCKLF